MSEPKTALLPFEEVERGLADKRRIFEYRTDKVRSQLSGRVLDVDRVVSPDWVNVVAIADEGDEPVLVCVRQWRFGRSVFSLEIPAGIVDEGEEPRAAALRELREETGYVPVDDDEVVCLGRTLPNPAFLTNELTTFFVPRAVQRHALSLDDSEEIEVVRIPLGEVDRAVTSGQIESALVLVALYRWRLHETRGA